MKQELKIMHLGQNRIRSVVYCSAAIISIIILLWLFNKQQSGEITQSSSSLIFALTLIILFPLALIFGQYNDVIQKTGESSFESFTRLGWMKLKRIYFERLEVDKINVDQDPKRYYRIFIVLKDGREIFVDRKPTKDKINEMQSRLVSLMGLAKEGY